MTIETVERRKKFVNNLKRMRSEIRDCIADDSSSNYKGEFTKEELMDLENALTIAILTMWLG